MRIDGRYFVNWNVCGPIWTNSPSAHSGVLDFCEAMTGNRNARAYLECEPDRSFQDRYRWVDDQWVHERDNGFARHVRCQY